MKKVTPFLTFKEKGEEAIKFYTSLIPNSRIHSLVLSEQDGPISRGALQHASFELDGQHFMAMDGGPSFEFDQGFSIYIDCQTQEEIDHLWEKLSEGGEVQMCGWVKDRYGISWQIVPTILGELVSDPDAEKASQVFEAMLKMQKLDIRALEEAYVR